MLIREQFGHDFKWGVSTSAYQIEGAATRDGKGQSIWDVFTSQKGNIANGENGKNACNHYDLYTLDIAMMASMNIPNYRFSIAWSRILPEGFGKPNIYGLDYYNRLIDFCLEVGIEPWITLYHWDLPNNLEKLGGWTNRDIIGWFEEYVSTCLKYFGGRVKNWIILNEPMVFTGAGYFMGVHAPGRKGISNFLPAVHHAALCQAEGGRMVRSFNSELKVGTTFSCSLVEPYRNTENDMEASKTIDALLNRLFIEPLLGMGYPVNDLKVLKRMEPYIKTGDERKLEFDMDFIGVQNYTREMVRYNLLMPYVQSKIIDATKRGVETTLMDWEIYPPSIYKVLKKFAGYSNIKELIVTENGAAFPDEVKDGRINDEKRIEFLQDHLTQIYRAKKEGINVKGYFIWSFLDNFEWAKGYEPRFGLVHVDFLTQERIIKESGHWYSKFLKAAVAEMA